MFVNTFWSLVPPIVAIGLALLTKETYSSLFIGIVVGALLATDFSPIGALDTIINDGLTAAIADNAGIFLFLVILGVMVALKGGAIVEVPLTEVGGKNRSIDLSYPPLFPHFD